MQAVAADATVPLLSCAAAIFIWCIFTAISRPRILLAGLGLGLTGVAAQEFFNEPMRVPLQVTTINLGSLTHVCGMLAFTA
jgi:hypothetical protein